MTMMNGYAFGFGGVFMMLFWVFVIAAIVWVVLTFARPRTAGEDRTARRILEERLARGEIDAEEFRARRVALEEATR